jgi:hypothetical protein
VRTTLPVNRCSVAQTHCLLGSDKFEKLVFPTVVSYDFYVKRTNNSPTIPVPSSPSLVQELKATASETELSQADVIRQSLKLGMAALRARLGKAPRRHLPLWEHFRRLKGLELPPWLH